MEKRHSTKPITPAMKESAAQPATKKVLPVIPLKEPHGADNSEVARFYRDESPRYSG